MNRVTFEDVEAWVHENFYEVPAYLVANYESFDEFDAAGYDVTDALNCASEVFDELKERGERSTVYVEKRHVCYDDDMMMGMGFTMIHDRNRYRTMLYLHEDEEEYALINFAMLYKNVKHD